MIARLSGKILALYADRAVLDVHDVGYELLMSTDTLSRLPEVGGSVFVHVYTNVREDAISLYGFLAEEEKELFLLLRTVSGIGPRVALAMLSGLRVEPLCSAIVNGDVKRLTTLQGIGKKTAERICMELKDKVAHLASGRVSISGRTPLTGGGSAVQDTVSALTNFGYSETQVRTALAGVKKEVGEETFSEMAVEELSRLALRALA
ncbi:Holliday junction branch migration protein RuvA [Desulforhopalus vacuolatus]|uniref:Holliday junction branch migration protein RuvA n=1 Tax=Desulforhopalus vacuolatus TaxID=40414 RepID=UPI0019627B15|nr:Holliday junction branch migration protein RuvA [Desulforhopalus vacuolatus]MBM9518520.1 Holliday junction branch migration protein RuvA [Desulforhopalus vacuolatus]